LALSRKLGQDGDLRFGGRIDRVKNCPIWCLQPSFTVRQHLLLFAKGSLVGKGSSDGEQR
jgi:hypothetical protein